MVWWLRVFRCDWVDVELSAEIESGRSEREAADVNPKIELVACPPTAEALKEISTDVDREAPFLFGASAGGADWAVATPLWTALADGLVAEQLEHSTDGDPVSDCPIVELAHGLRSLAPPFLAVPGLAWRAACCSAR